MPGTKRPDVCGSAGATAGHPTCIRDAAHALQQCFAGAKRPPAVLAHSPHVANLRHLWVLAYMNGLPRAAPPCPTASDAILGMERVMARQAVHDLKVGDIDAWCQALRSEPEVMRSHGVMYACNMLWACIWWHNMPPAAAPPADLKILDLFHLDSLKRAAQVPELRAAALTVFAHAFELRPGERVLAQYQVPTSSAKLSVLQVLEFCRPAPYVVGLANSITFDDLSAILKDKPQAMEALVFAMFRARARSLVDGFDFAGCVWAATEFETRAGPEAARRAAKVKPIVLRWDVNRYHVCGQDGHFVRCDTAQQAISVWRHLLRTQYGDVVDNRLSFAGLLG